MVGLLEFVTEISLLGSDVVEHELKVMDRNIDINAGNIRNRLIASP
jgi:hypothetical protein